MILFLFSFPLEKQSMEKVGGRQQNLTEVTNSGNSFLEGRRNRQLLYLILLKEGDAQILL